MDCDVLLSLKRKTGNPHLADQARSYLLAIVHAEEGSVMTYQLLAANLKRMQTLSETNKYINTSVLGCYWNDNEAVEDVYGLTPTISRFKATDLNSWMEASGKDTTEPPNILEITSNFKKHRRPFNMF